MEKLLKKIYEPPKGSIRDIEEEIKIKELIRKAKLKQIEDWVGFVSAKTTGLSLVIAGSLETFLPDILPIVLENSPEVTGVGLGLLVGKNAIDFVGKLFDGLRKK